jgi:hypothetical protein
MAGRTGQLRQEEAPKREAAGRIGELTVRGRQNSRIGIKNSAVVQTTEVVMLIMCLSAFFSQFLPRTALMN